MPYIAERGQDFIQIKLSNSKISFITEMQCWLGHWGGSWPWHRSWNAEAGSKE